MENWISEQIARNSRGFDAAMLEAYPESRRCALEPERYLERVCHHCNYFDVVKRLDWSRIIQPSARVPDVAGGTGWLTEFLSSFEAVREITIVDASSNYLRNNLPVSVRRLGGDMSKVRSVVGYFAPLLFDDASFDLVVVSSSLHHADNLEVAIGEIHRAW